jgi:magnesium transporter
MITLYAGTPRGLRRSSNTLATGLASDIIWIDLLNPTAEEERGIEELLGLDVPTREEMQEIEISSRLYIEGNAQYMTASLICRAETDNPQTTPVTFILAGGRLLTVRYEDPRPFQTFPLQVERHGEASSSALDVLLGLLEAVVDRTADILERVQGDVDKVSSQIFAPSEGKSPSTERSNRYRTILRSVGRSQLLTLKARESLVSIGRVVGFLGRPSDPKPSKPEAARLKTLQRDVGSLSDHATHLAQTITFLLEATLGLINIQQNEIIKIFSIAAVVFLPPTLVASIYGMNFRYMPELSWIFGYPLALGLLVLAGLLPYWYFKRRGWL